LDVDASDNRDGGVSLDTTDTPPANWGQEREERE
jgi:hypothetical protein